MDHLSDRLTWLIIGIVIGYFAAMLQVRLMKVEDKVDAVKEELDEVDAIVKRKKDERGRVSLKLNKNVAVGVAVLVTCWAAFVSQKASNDVQNQQDVIQTQQSELDESQARLASLTKCIQRVTSETVNTLNEVTKPSRIQALDNAELQKAQAKFLRIVIGPPPPTKESGRAALTRYYDRLNTYVKSSAKYKQTASNNPYPKKGAIQACMNQSK